jgi:hypothetical protein
MMAPAMEESFKRMLQKTMVKDDGDGAAAAEEETDQAAESNIAQDLPQAGFSDVVLEEQDPVATERSKRQRARSMLNIASSGAPPFRTPGRWLRMSRMKTIDHPSKQGLE